MLVVVTILYLLNIHNEVYFSGFGSQEVPTQPIVFTSPAKINQPKKKKKAPVIKPLDKKDGDIRALFSTNTKSTKNYTKTINDLGIQNDGLPTRLISLLVDLSLDNTNTTKKCYLCQNICECALIQSIREPKKILPILTIIKEPNLPDIDLIDDFDADTIKKCAKKPEEIKQNISNNFDLDTDFLSLETCQLPTEVEIKKQNVSVASNNFDIGEIADIFADSSPEEAIENEIAVKVEEPKEAKETLGFFLLDSLDDMFADDEIDNTPPEPGQTIPKDNNNTQNVKVNRAPSVEYPLSPSILSGRQKPNVLLTSPILCSQPRKFQLSTKKDKLQSSTPFSSCRKQLLKEPMNNNNLSVGPADKPDSLRKHSLIDTSNKSMFTITQLVEIINKPDGNELRKTANVSKKVEPVKQRSVSPILLTQAERKKSAVNLSNSNVPIASTSQTKIARSESLIILDSDSDSDSTQIYNLSEALLTNKTCLNKNETISPLSCKRKRDNDDSDIITASPYFNKKQKLDDKNERQMTLQEKVLAVITSNKNKMNENDRTVMSCMIPQPDLTSQKENKNPQFLKDDEDDCPKKNNLSMLQMFRRDSKLDIVKSKFNTIFKKSPIKPDLPQKRKIAFDDSDDDFVSDEDRNHRSPCSPIENKYKSTTNHKVRKVSLIITYLFIYLRPSSNRNCAYN